MANLKTIRKRIATVKATQKITRAMKMVAGARLNRAQQRITALRPYALKTEEILSGLATAMIDKQTDLEYSASDAAGGLHPLLERRPEKNVLLIVLSGDRGLAGGFNANASKAAFNAWKGKQSAGAEVQIVTAGKKGREFLVRRKATIARDFPKMYENLDLAKSRDLAEYVTGKFIRAEVDSVYIVYNEFKSAITQQIVTEPLLPLPEPPPRREGALEPTEYRFEPSEGAVLERLMPLYVEISIYRALLESHASELGARMTAMDAATRNAKEMIGRLTLVYNRARQAAITKELMEIIGGAEALKE
jgi:F-type H+-transporting ATPase subunit gamma